jgi:tetratricopeptide (TPR) repeat protein
MFVGAMSEDCFHCVKYGEVPGRDQLSEFMTTISGTACMLCGVRTNTYLLLVDAEDVARARAGGSVYSAESAAEFGQQRSTRAGGSSKAAEQLRGQLSGRADRQRRAVLEKLSETHRADFSFEGGQRALAAGDKAKATAAFTICAGTGKPPAYRAAIQLGDLAAADGRGAAAIKWYRRATAAAEPEVKAAAHLYLGVALRKANRPAEAYDALRTATVDGPVAIRGLAGYGAGQALEELGRREEAKAAYRQALSLDTHGSAGAAMNLGALAEEDGDWTQARRYAEYAVKSGEPGPAQNAAFNLARYWEHRRRGRKARKYYEMAARGDNEGLAMRARAMLG